MSFKADQLQLDIIINGDPARLQLLNLSKEAQAVKDNLAGMKKGTDEYIKASSRLGDISKEQDKIISSFKVTDLTIKELIKREKELKFVRDNSPPNTEQWKAYDKELQTVSNRKQELQRNAKGVGDALNQQNSMFGNLISSIKGYVLGFGAAVLSVETFKKVINSADAVSDKFEETISGMKFGADAFFRALATGDFSNFITNLTEAVKLGREYARAMDEIEERTRALSIVESEQRIKILDLQKVMKDQRLSSEDRAKAGFEALKLENQLMQDKYSISRKNFDMELKVAAHQAGMTEASVANFIKQRNANNELVNQAEDYLKALEDLKIMQREGVKGDAAQKAMDEMRKTINATSTSIRVYATEVVSKMGNVSTEQLDKTAKSWVDLNNTQVEFREGTKRTWSTYTGLLDEISKKGKKAGEDEVKHQEEIISLLTQRRAIEVMYMDGKIEDLEEWLKKLGLEASTYKEMIVYINQLGQLRMGLKDFGGGNGMPAAPGEMQKIANPEPGSGSDKKDDPWSTENVLNYANTVYSTLSSVDQFMTQRENAELERDRFVNDQKKENLKKQLDAKRISQAQYNSAIEKLDNDLAKKQRKLVHDQAVRQKELSLIQAIINVAQGVTAALAGTPPASYIMAALTGILGAVQIGFIASSKVPQAAMGRYDVIGQQDGRLYRDVPYQSSMTGIPGSPMLVNETGNEIVIDPRTTRNIQMNYPQIIDAINYARVTPQRAGGQYVSSSTGGSDPMVVLMDPKLQASLDRYSDISERMLKEGLQARMAYDEFTRVDDKVTRIENDARRG